MDEEERGGGRWARIDGALPFGLALIVLGVLLALDNLEVVDVTFGRLMVPGLLVIVGGGLLQAGLRIRSARLEVAGSGAVAGPAATAVFGDARLVIAEGGADPGHVVATATAVLGDVTVEVPAGWRIEDRITRLLGDVTLPPMQPNPPGSPVAEVHGVVLFGDVRVRYVDLVEGGR